MTRVLDRVVHFDDRSKAYPIRTLLGAVPRSWTWRHVQLDQGQEGACAGFSATMEAAARPAPFFGDPIWKPPSIPTLNALARSVYLRAQFLDDMPGQNYEGTSVLGATKAGMERKWWGEYCWALGPGSDLAAQQVILALGPGGGPVMMGTNWHNNMFDADPQGYLHPSGGVAGGHAYVLTAYSVKRDAVWTPNSWGGQGQGWIRRADLVSLLHDQGEACIPVTRRMPTA